MTHCEIQSMKEFRAGMGDDLVEAVRTNEKIRPEEKDVMVKVVVNLINKKNE